MSIKDSDLTPDIVSYVKNPIILGLRNLIHTANELHLTHGNNTMSEAVEKFLLGCLSSLESCNHKPQQEGKVTHPDETAPGKKASGGNKKAKSHEPEPVKELEQAPESDASDLFDSREEAVDALGLPTARADAEKLKLSELVRITYGVGNEDPAEYLSLPSKADAASLKKKELLSLIYGA